MNVYVETSALLRWAYSADGALHVEDALARADTLVASSLTITEARRAIARAEATGAIGAASARTARGRVEKTARQIMEMAISATVQERCGRPFPVEPVRTLDAIHLASFLELLEVFEDLRILTFDRRIRENAEALGIDVV